MFLEYQNPREAAEAVKSTDGYRLDKQHTFQVNLFTDFDKYSSVPEEWEPPAPQEYKDPVIKLFVLRFANTSVCYLLSKASFSVHATDGLPEAYLLSVLLVITVYVCMNRTFEGVPFVSRVT